MESSLKHYTQQMATARSQVALSTTVSRLGDPEIDHDVFLRWLIEFSSRGVQMTEPVEGWVRRAGEATIAVGLEAIGTQLVKHAKHEADHHLMMIEDTKRLVARWNRTHDEQLDAEQLIARPPTPSMQAYVDLHEEVIASDSPYRQVAIEREIEGLSLSVGPRVVDQCTRVLGTEGLGEVSFITDHVELDAGHTIFNEKLLGKLLDARPEARPGLVETGSAALIIYLGFLSGCFERGPIPPHAHLPQPSDRIDLMVP